MTTIKDLDRIVPELIGQLEQLKSDISRYKKFDIDVRARQLLKSVKEKIKKINNQYNYFKNTPEYHSDNFDSFVNEIKDFITSNRKYYEQILTRANVSESFAQSPFKDKENELDSLENGLA